MLAEERKTLITKGGSDARYLVQVDLWLTREGQLVERSWRYREVSRRVAPDPVVEELVRSYAARLDRELDTVIGRADAPLEARSHQLRTQETNLGDFVADRLRERLETDAAVINAGAIRTNRTVPPGPLTKRDVHSLLPFTDVVMKLELRGRDLRAALEHGLAQTDRVGGGFLQVSAFVSSGIPSASPVGESSARPSADERWRMTGRTPWPCRAISCAAAMATPRWRAAERSSTAPPDRRSLRSSWTRSSRAARSRRRPTDASDERTRL